MTYGALDNREFFIQKQLKKAGNEKLQNKLKIELNKCEKIKFIQIIYTPDLTDTSIATTSLRFFRSDVFLFIVGINTDC